MNKTISMIILNSAKKRLNTISTSACMSRCFYVMVSGKRSLCFINPLAIMFICVILSKLLPQTSFVNGVVSMGQQSIGFFIVFLALLITCGNLRGGE